jgi:hypothetical protein
VAQATFTLKCRFQTLIELPDEFGAVQMVMVTSSGGTPGPYPVIPPGEVHTRRQALPHCSRVSIDMHRGVVMHTRAPVHECHQLVCYSSVC